MKKFLEEFKTFALKGNVMDIAVGVIIGAAFQAIVSSLVSDIISPLIDTLSVSINGATLAYGKFITAVINFLIMAFVLFMIVKTINKISSMLHEEKVEENEKSDELIALEKIVSLLEEKK
jgi:large conductance mechanosensitive channel